MPTCFNTLTLGTFFKIGLLGFFRMLWRINGLPRHFFLLIALILKWATLPVGLKDVYRKARRRNKV
jgi:hypothetical protein